MNPGRHKQQPHQHYQFSCGHAGELPGIGKSNDVARWAIGKGLSRGGRWECRRCHVRQAVDADTRRRAGKGPKGKLGIMEIRFRQARRDSKMRGHKPPITTPERMLAMWESQKDKCIACHAPLELLKSVFDHNHETGIPRGFIHDGCNKMEGFMNKMLNENFAHWCDFYRPGLSLSLNNDFSFPTEFVLWREHQALESELAALKTKSS